MISQHIFRGSLEEVAFPISLEYFYNTRFDVLSGIIKHDEPAELLRHEFFDLSVLY